MTELTQIFGGVSWVLAIDFTVVFLLVYGCLYLIKSAKSLDLIYSIFVIFGVYALSYIFKLDTLKWLIEKFAVAYVIILAIIFQVELKRAVDRVRFSKWFGRVPDSDVSANPLVIKKLLTSVDQLCKEKLGALIVIEAEFKLDQFIETGIQINGEISSDLLISLFWKGAPTHDGAVILRGSHIVAAGCFLPLTDSTKLDSRLGTRHMAAIGLSEQSDSLIIVVSEETGTISIGENGNITRYLNREALETRLFNLYKEQQRTEMNLG